MTYTAEAKDLRPGDAIDALPIVIEYGGDGLHAALYEYYVTESVMPAESVGGRRAVVLYTDQGSWKIPADFEVEVLQ